MLTIGITGGIGSGKTEVTNYLAAKGIVIADADQAARRVVEPGQPALTAIAKHFGDSVLQPDGQLNRRALRELVFHHPEQRQWLEQLTHPLINQLLVQQLEQANSPYGVLVAPLLLEAGQDKLVDRVLVIDTTEELQIQRAIARDTITREQAEAILKAQISRSQRRSRADDIVDNSGSLEHLHRQLDRLHQTYIHLAGTK